MDTYIIYMSENNGMRIKASDYFIDSFGMLTFSDDKKNHIGVFNMRNIIGFMRIEEEYVDEPQNLQTV